jgi:hypothetical protein
VLSENELAARTSSLELAYADVPQILLTHDEKPVEQKQANKSQTAA